MEGKAAVLAPFPAEWRRVFTPEELERLAVRTQDGEMSDQEALKAEGLTRKLWIARAEADKQKKEARA